jgi:hypothetical protein
MKPETAFSKNARNSDGLQRDCKSCAAARYQANREKIRSQQKANWKRYSEANSDRLKSKNVEYRKQHPEASRLQKERYRAASGPKVEAKNKVWSHVLTGRIKKQPCEVCGEPKADAHHDDYSKPLDVRWLCRKHHAEWHAVHGEGLNGRAHQQQGEQNV